MSKSKPTKRVDRQDQGTTSDAHGGAGSAARPGWLCVVLVLIGLGVYANSFRGVFLFDDIDAILLNDSIRKLSPIADVLMPPAYKPVSGRPVLNLTFALNYACGGLKPAGYHAVNLAIHLAAGLLLLGLVRRTMSGGRVPERYRSKAAPLAAVAAVLWVVHPLQTESVTYIVQRAESLVGLFYLSTLYCLVRGIQGTGKAAVGWFVGGAVACALGMAAKENMATAPLMALLLDRVFFSRSFRETFRQRWAVHLVLGATLLILAVLMAGGPRSDSAGFNIKSMTALDYVKSQPQVILHYLRLAVWPHPLCLDYRWPIVGSWPAIVIPAVVLTLAVLASVWAFRRWAAVAYLGVWFFLVLAPTSSFVPLKDLAFEHRMYLPLAAIILMLVLLADHIIDYLLKNESPSTSAARRLKLVSVALVAAVLGGLTIRRNTDYYDAISMWKKVIALRPDNARAVSNLGVLYGILGRHEEAVETCRRAVTMDPREEAAQANLAKSLAKLGRYEEAVTEYRKALVLLPDDVQVMYSMGLALEALGRFDEAEGCYREVIARDPGSALAFLGLGICLQRKADYSAAAEAFRRSIDANPKDLDARARLASCLAKLGKPNEAIDECRRSLKSDPRHAVTWYILGNVYSGIGRWTEALDAYRQAVASNPTNADARYNLGVALFQLGQMDEAIAAYREVLLASPRHAKARLNLGDALVQQGRYDEAAVEFMEVLRIEPGNQAAQAALEALKTRRPSGR